MEVSMRRVALIGADNVVANVIVAHDDYAAPTGVLAVDHPSAGVGWSWDGTALSAPPDPLSDAVPARIATLQLLRQMRADGREANYATFLESLSGTLAADWQEMVTVTRADPAFVPALKSALSLTDDQLDTIWRAAALQQG